MDISYPCDRSVVESILPHRDPFLWVTRVLECESGVSIVAELDVDPSFPVFEGHFPDYPVFPGVLIMEALAQAACFCILTDESRLPGSLGFLTGIDEAKFRRQVKPGETVRLEAEMVKMSKRMCVAKVHASIDDEPVASAVQKYVLAASR